MAYLNEPPSGKGEVMELTWMSSGGNVSPSFPLPRHCPAKCTGVVQDPVDMTVEMPVSLLTDLS